jgi:Alpha galactosidase A
MRRITALFAAGIAAATMAVAVGIPTAAPAHALDDGLAVTPPMGWNDWNAFGCNVSEQLVEQTAAAMVADGMKAAGYDYVNIDDCWALPQRDANGNLVPDPAKFPDGIKAVADYVHSLGMKLGIYEDSGTHTCSSHGFPGSLGHEYQDALTALPLTSPPCTCSPPRSGSVSAEAACVPLHKRDRQRRRYE